MGKIWCGTELEEYTVYQIPLCGVLSEHKGKTWKLFCHSLVMDCKTARKWGRGSIFKNFSLYRFLLVSQNLCCTSVFFAKFSYSFTFLRRFRVPNFCYIFTSLTFCLVFILTISQSLSLKIKKERPTGLDCFQ